MERPTTDEPSAGRVFLLHLCSAACLGVGPALSVLLPFIARVRFGASDWQTTVLTAAVPVTQFLSIFWGDLYGRWSRGRYLLLVMLLGCAPIAAIGLAGSIWHVMGLYVVAAAGGFPALSPLNADLFRRGYSADRRGRVVGAIYTAQFASAMLAGLGIGAWCDRYADAFRIIFPLLAGVLVTGLVIMGWIFRRSVFVRSEPPPVHAPAAWWKPLTNMVSVLRQDRRFAGYEAAFMSYGVGWMICTALVPALATDRLRLNYSQFSQATVVLYQLTNIIILLPLGRLADRIGPQRLAAASFLWLTVYPLGLIFVADHIWLGMCSVAYAAGMVGVQITWTLGPVNLAPDPARAPLYLAIHSTLVGVRGIVAQGLGMALYSATGRFEIPLLIAAAGFLWASRRMTRLEVSKTPARLSPSLAQDA